MKNPIFAIPVLNEVLAERERQDAKLGEQNWPSETEAREFLSFQASAELAKLSYDYARETGRLSWRHILLEEVYEALAEEDPVKRRAELVQVAAVAIAEIECIDRRGGK